jgi:heptosyltransferase-2
MDVDPSPLETRLMEKLIIRTPNHLGDCLMALPAIAALAKVRPDWEITILHPGWAGPIYETLASCRKISLPPDKLHGSGAIFYQAGIYMKGKYDIGVVMPPSFSSAFAIFLPGVKKRYGYTGQGRRILLNNGVNGKKGIGVHRSQSYKYLLEEAAEKKFEIENPRIDIAPEIRTDAEKLLDESGININEPIMAIAAQAVAPSRRWGSGNYRDLAAQLIKQYGGHIVLLGSPAEADAGAEIARGDSKIINLCGKTDIGTAAAVLSRCRLFIGNDSGLAHLAAAVGIPLVVLSGADKPSETSPLSDRKTVIIKNDLDCISCVKNYCPKKEDRFMRCMKEISVIEVLSAANKYLE